MVSGHLLCSLSCLSVTLVQGFLFSLSCRAGHISMVYCATLRLLLNVLLFSILLNLRLNKNCMQDVYHC